MAITEGTILRIVASIVFPDSVIMQNVFHAVLTAAGSSDAEEDVVSDMVDYLQDVWAEVIARVSEDMDTDEVKVYERDHIDDDWDEIGTSLFSVTFTGAGDWLPHGLCVVVNMETTDPDVSGRKYYGGLTEAVQEDGAWDATTLGSFATMLTEVVTPFVGAATGATFTPGVWSPTANNFFGFLGGGAVNAIPGYQRRRKPGVGI